MMWGHEEQITPTAVAVHRRCRGFAQRRGSYHIAAHGAPDDGRGFRSLTLTRAVGLPDRAFNWTAQERDLSSGAPAARQCYGGDRATSGRPAEGPGLAFARRGAPAVDHRGGGGGRKHTGAPPPP